MAEVSTSSVSKRGSKVRAKKLSTRVDMTPMVDLAFLLLTFFILTSTFSKFYIVDIDMPETDTHQTPPLVNEKDVINILVDQHNKVYWWIGLNQPVHETDFTSSGLRAVLQEKKTEIKNLVVLIKLNDKARYETLISVLDEVQISKIKGYSIVDPTKEDEHLIAQRPE